MFIPLIRRYRAATIDLLTRFGWPFHCELQMNLTEAYRARIDAAWNAIAPKRIAAIHYGDDAIHVLHPTKGWRRITHKRLGIAR